LRAVQTDTEERGAYSGTGFYPGQKRLRDSRSQGVTGSLCFNDPDEDRMLLWPAVAAVTLFPCGPEGPHQIFCTGGSDHLL